MMSSPPGSPPAQTPLDGIASSAQLASWFGLLRQMLPSPGPGLVTMIEGGACGTVAVSEELTPEATDALLQTASSVAASGAPLADHNIYAHPLRDGGQLFAVVAMEINVPNAQQPVVQHLLSWSERWLQLLLETGAGGGAEDSAAMLSLVEEILTTSPLEAALLKLADSLAGRVDCSRVAIGMRSGGKFQLRALSHGLQFDKRTKLASELALAMQGIGDSVRVWPQDNADEGYALRRLADSTGEQALCGVPLGHVGVAVLERPADKPFSAAEQRMLAEAGRLLGPVLAQKLAHAMLLPGKVQESAEGLRDRLLKPGHWGTKLAFLVPLVLILFLTFVPWTFRVHADANIEGLIQRAVVAPFDGFIAEANYRAGDPVENGEVIARMEDRELLLELRKSTSEEEKLDTEYRKALAAGDRSEASIVQARLSQVQAETRLLNEKLERIQLRAPLAGIIISGDLSRALGAPVERGEVLFEVAPLDEYRLVLNIEESRVAHVAPGQTGTLTLTALPGEQFTFTLEQLSPVFQEKEGRVLYRAEAVIEGETPVLRPGMEGVGKIEVGRRSIGWVLFHRPIDWLRLRLWLWLP